MATSTFDIKLVIKPEIKAPNINPVVKDRVNEKPKVDRTRPPVFTGLTEAEANNLIEDTTPEPTIADIIDGYDTVEKAATDIKAILKNRMTGVDLSCPIDKSEQPTEYSYLSRLFKNHQGAITFEMYSKLLEYREEINTALAGE